MTDGDAWDGYVARFHDEEPGITEDLLGRTDDDGTDPDAWCVEPLLGRHGTGWPRATDRCPAIPLRRVVLDRA